MNGDVMLAEMDEQPVVLARLAGRWNEVAQVIASLCPTPLAGVSFVARGSSDNAAVLGRYLVEMAVRRPAALAAPSIITRYDVPVDYRGWMAVALSQSGATPEVVTVVEAMRANGAVTVGVSNELAGPLGDAVDVLLGCDAGPERAVPATKTVTAQMLLMMNLAAALGPVPYATGELAALPTAVAAVLADAGPMRLLGERWAGADRLFVVGRGVMYAAALEAALKIKETTAVLAEGLSTADLLHGPVAAVGPGTPVLLLDGGGVTHDDITEVAGLLHGRGADVVVVSADPDADVRLWGSGSEAVHVLAATVRGQQLAHALSVARGMDPDRPVGLSKVTATH
jgi:glucosamine--fructose-6-phosphate aminotransferase (isomerizing)